MHLRLLATLTGLLVLFQFTTTAQDIKLQHDNTEFQGFTRDYYTFVPETKAEGRPIVILLHGYGGTNKNYRPEFIEEAQKRGFGVCVPAGLKDTTNHPGWNVGYPMQAAMKVDDVAFVSYLVDYVCKQYGFNPQNAFLCGMSNGGEMCYYFAYREPKRFRAISSVAGLTMAWIPETYSSAKGKVPFMEIHGNADKISLWSGDIEGKEGWGRYLGIEDAIARIAKKDGCKLQETVELPLLRSANNPKGPSNQVTLYRYAKNAKALKSNKKASCEVRLYKVERGEHCWHLQDFDTCGESLKFFENYIVR